MNYIPVLYYLLTIAVCSYLFYKVVYSEKLSLRWKIILWIIIGMLALALYPMSALLGGLTMDGKYVSSIFYQDKSQEILITDSNIQEGTSGKGSTSYRLKSTDLESGKTLASNTLEDAITPILPEANSFIWFYNSDHGLHARSAESLDVLIDEKGLIAKNPQLATGLLDVVFYENPSTKNIVVASNSGYFFEIDSTNFLVKPTISQADISSMKAISINPDDHYGDYKLNKITLKSGEEWTMEGDPRSQIFTDSSGKSSPLSPDGTTYLSGVFLADTETNHHIETTSPQGVALVSQSSLQNNTYDTLTLVSVTGKELWKKTLFQSSDDDFIKAAHYFQNTLIILTNREIISLNAADGSIIWTNKL